MNRIGFSFEQYHDPWGNWEGVVPLVDGVSLLKLIADFELAKDWDVPGQYAGIAPAFIDAKRWIRSLRGQGRPEYEQMESTWLLGCGSSVAGCWPLEARVVIEADTVAWDRFRQPFRPKRDYSGFGPFVFHRGEYEGAVDELAVSLVVR